jgi:IS5 family transposase
MHQTKKGNQWYHRCAEGFAYGMKVHIGVDKDTGLIRSVEITAANVHDLTPAADLLHGKLRVVYADAGYQGIEKHVKMVGRSSGFRGAISTG